MFKKILCPLDFSLSSRRAMSVAVDLARATNAELVLVHVWQVPSVMTPSIGPYPGDVIESLVADDERSLAEAVTEARKLGAAQVTSRFQTGAPWERIVATLSAEPGFDLVVMGSEGRTAFQRMLLGSVAEKVLRRAPCSVLVVRGDDPHGRFHRILCPVDFTPSSRHAMSLAAELVARDGAGISLLHVLELPIALHGEVTTPGFAADLDRRSADHLETWVTELRGKVAVPVEAHTRIGTPAAQTLRLLETSDAYDLVIVGSHGRTGLARVFLGSVAEKLARHAPCSVLMARARVERAAAD